MGVRRGMYSLYVYLWGCVFSGWFLAVFMKEVGLGVRGGDFYFFGVVVVVVGRRYFFRF